MHKSHEEAENRLIDLLLDYEFLCDDATYHNNMKKEIVNLLQNSWGITSLYVRARADRIAIHQKLPGLCFEWDVKTKDNSKYDDMMIELLPFLLHVLHYQELGKECFYAFFNPFNGQECGFWTSDLPEIDWINIPPREVWSMHRVMLSTLSFNRLGIQPTEFVSNGSGDPFIKIQKSELDKLPNWEDCISQKIASFKEEQEAVEFMKSVNNGWITQ